MGMAYPNRVKVPYKIKKKKTLKLATYGVV